ncbi:MAG: hypothetical protein GXY15_13405, partial [Candidatus Hydrogenedentes bacterium]|nr:hypothetical protein [Candidatus Hydrogenedentota bacterium]
MERSFWNAVCPLTRSLTFRRGMLREGVSVVTLIALLTTTLQPWGHSAPAGAAKSPSADAPMVVARVPETSPAAPLLPQEALPAADTAVDSSAEPQAQDTSSPEYWTRVAKVMPTAGRTSQEDVQAVLAKARTIRSPKARDGRPQRPDVRRYRPGAQDSAPAPAPSSGSAQDAPVAAVEKGGAEGPADLLARGDTLLRENRLAEAMTAYFRVVDEFPGSAESAALDNVVNALAWDAEAGAVDPVQLLSFVDSLPGPASCRSEKSTYWVAAANQIAGEHLLVAGKDQEAKAYLEKGRGAALSAMRDLPASPYQIFFPGHFIRSCRLLGGDELVKGVETLKALVRGQERTTMLKFAARLALTMSIHRDFNDITEAAVQCGSLLDEYEGSDPARMLDERTGEPNVRAHVEFALGYVRFQMSHFGTARRHFEAVAKEHPENARLADASLYMAAYLTELAAPNDYPGAVAAYSGYLERSPGGEYTPKALVRMAAAYDRAGELTASVQLLRETAETFSYLPWTEQLKANIADREAAIAAGMENKLRADRLRGDHGEGLCGPFALALLLQDAGMEADVLTLAREAGSDASGTSLAGLLAAGAARGLGLSAARMENLSDLRTPAIAHLAPNHFVLVRAVEADGVLVEDPSGQRRLTREAFQSAFSGFVLTTQKLEPDSPWLSQEVLESVRGACEEFFTDLNEGYLQCINQQCIPLCPVDKSTGSNFSPGDANMQSFSGPGLPQRLNTPTTQPQMLWSPPGVSLGMTTNHRALKMQNTDISLTTRGGLRLEFTRKYSNPWGDHTAYMRDQNRPYKNNLGSGWWHSLNTHVRASIEDGYAYYLDECGNTKHFTRTDTYDQDGKRLYSRTPWDTEGEDTNALREERSVVLRQDPSAKWFELIRGDGMTYHYSAPIHAEDKYCRLEWYRDRSGNTVTLTYSDCIITEGDPPVNTNYGRLSRVDTPSGDGRYLTFTYSGNQLSRVELRESADPSGLIKYVEYTYGPCHTLQQNEQDPYPGEPFLRSVQGDGSTQDIVSYEYDAGEYNNAVHGRFPWKITDKRGAQAEITFEYAIVPGESFVSANRITLEAPDGVVMEVQKTDHYMAAIRHYDGTTLLSRTEYALGPHGVQTTSVAMYPDPSQPAAVTWTYGYNATDIYDFRANVMTGATYEYNAKGRVTKAWQGGVYYRYEYAAGNDLHPVRMYGPGTSSDTDKGPVTEYTYDAAGRIYNVKPPNMGSNGITYSYDGYGQVISVLDPAGDVEYFQYDTRGNRTSHTDKGSNTTTFTYDDLGRVLTATAPGNRTTAYTYTGGCSSCGGAAGLVSTITTPDNKTTSFTYDANGNRLTATDPMNRTTTYAYNSMDRPTTVTLPDSRTMSYSYDKLGRPVAVTGADGRITRHQYDYRGLLLKTWLENDPGTTADDDTLVENEYDTLGRLTKVTDAKGQIINYTYTGRGEVEKTIHGSTNLIDPDPAKIYLTNLYDTYGRLIKTGAWTFSPDNPYTDPVEYFYNNTTGQLTKKRFTNGTDVKEIDYSYDILGRPVQVDDWLGGTGSDGHHFEYDDNGRVTTYTDFDDAELTLAYDAYGQVTSMTAYEAGNTHAYAYDTMGRLTTLTAPGNRQWGFTYNDAGQPVSYTWPNGMSTHYTYDTAGRLEKIEHKDGSTVKAGWAYELTADDNIVRIADTRAGVAQAWEYEYDSRSRLIHALRFGDNGKPQFRQEFVYDEADNMTSVTTLTFSQRVWDTFADGNYTASPPWTVQSGTWSAAAYDLAPVPATGTRTISTATTTRSPELRLDYYLPPSLQGLFDSFSVYVRYVDASNYLRIVWVWGSLVVYETVAGVETQLAMFPYASMTMDSWQTLAVQVRLDKLAVYHAPRGKAPRLLGGDIAVSTTMNTNSLRLGVSGQSGFRFDSVSVHARSLDAAKSTTYAYNTSNQLTSSVTNGTTTSYTYDAWGRLLTRTAGTASASYAYRGDKLKQVTSTFPNEDSVAMNYDGLGRRRNRMANGVSPITWWRYGLGWDTVAEYTDNDTDWAVEGFSKFNVMTDFMHPLAEATVASGQPPANAAYSYLALDHLSSTRGVFSQTKSQTGTMEFLPYGA